MFNYLSTSDIFICKKMSWVSRLVGLGFFGFCWLLGMLVGLSVSCHINHCCVFCVMCWGSGAHCLCFLNVFGMTYMQGQSSMGGHYATSRMVTGLIPDGVIWIFHSHNLFGRVTALVERGCHWNHVCFLWGVAEADETVEHQTYKSVEHSQVAEVLNEINAQFAVRIKKWAVQELVK
jgi:hypothetical protein